MWNGKTTIGIMTFLCCYGLVGQEKKRASLPPDRRENGLLLMSVTQASYGSPGGSSEHRPGRLVIHIKNVSPAQLFIEDTMPELDFSLQIVDEAGQSVPLTEEAKKYPFFRDPANYVHVGRIRSVKLYPDEIYEKEMDVAQLFEIKPGQTYVVRVKTAMGPSRDHARNPVDRNLSQTVKLVMPFTEPK